MVIFYDSSSFAGSSDSSSIITFAPRHPGSLALRPSLCIGCGLCVRIDRVLEAVPLPVLATVILPVLVHCFQHFKKLFLRPGQKPNLQ